MDEETLNRLAGNVLLTEMDQSIVISAANGVFSVGNNINLKRDSSMLDLSALISMPDRNRKSKMQEMMEATAQSQKGKTGQFGKMLASLRPPEESKIIDPNDVRTDPDLMSS